MVFGNGVKKIQAAAYNGARTVCTIILHNEDEFIKAILNITIVLSQHFGSFMA